MKTVTEIVNKGLVKSNDYQPLSELKEQCQLNALETKMIKQLWPILMETYTSTFLKHNTECPSPTWARHIKGLTPKQVATGISNLPPKWPPTPIEFRQICLATNCPPGGLWEAYKVIPASRCIEDLTSRDKRLAKGREELTKIRGSFA